MCILNQLHTVILYTCMLVFSSFSPFAAVTLCGVASLAETFPSFPVRGPFLPDLPGFRVPSFRSQLWSSSRALPLNLHCSDVFCFISSFDVPERFQPSPSYDNHYRFHHCVLQGLLISSMFQQAHTHFPSSHHTLLFCFHSLFIFC